MKGKTIFLALILTVSVAYCSFAADIKARFADKEKIRYKILFNGVPAGSVEWEYLGRETVEGKNTEVISLISDTKILKLLDLAGKEKVFLDVATHLPLKVQRDIVFFGKKEVIEEIYAQQEGLIKIRKINGGTEEKTFKQNTPIHNILALLYFFPADIPWKTGKWVTFNLPTQSVRIKMVSERTLKVNNTNIDSYFLIGRGTLKRFSIWLDKNTRLPLRLEFIVPVGKIIIVPE